MNIANALKQLYPHAIPFVDYELRDDLDGQGIKVVLWNSDKLGVLPTVNELVAASDAYDVTISVPDVVTMRQARLALLQSGMLAQVNTAVANMPGAAGDAARIEWEFSSTVERNRPLVQSLIGALGLTESQLDDLFRLAAAL